MGCFSGEAFVPPESCYPVVVLMNEHRVIESVLDALESRLEALHNKPFPGEFFRQALDFISNFADGCHHYKEEQCLFPAMEARGVPSEGGPIGMMLYEHDQGRACVAGMRQNLEPAEAGSADAVEAVRHYTMAYVNLLRQHIFKEDNILFRMASNVLTPGDLQALREKYAGTEQLKGAGVHQRYEALAAQLRAEAAAAHQVQSAR